MKKFLLSLVVVAAYTFTGTAAVVEFDFTTGYEDTEYVTEAMERDGVTIRMTNGSGSRAPQWYSRGTAVRIYAGNNIDISAKETIKSVTFAFADKQNVFKMGTSSPKVKPGKYELNEDGLSGLWTVGANKGTLIAGGVDAHARIQKITVETDSETGVNTVINDEEGVYVEGNTIVAPEGSLIYNACGMCVNGENVVNGLYVVRISDGRVVKVWVK
jgi:hypothetical protein